MQGWVARCEGTCFCNLTSSTTQQSNLTLHHALRPPSRRPLLTVGHSSLYLTLCDTHWWKLTNNQGGLGTRRSRMKIDS
ncbi:hypothetical protein ACN42_g9368 [Penicillium freii]|uniref:Uncharacterized protein n=1 Tax=Penicillium freii TaxID=48697 RepID=A0A117NLN0_PENFR|nr:hypothetical protein ACN42_g9368 [Penicillium freii]